jgi:hypothetical protein
MREMSAGLNSNYCLKKGGEDPLCGMKSLPGLSASATPLPTSAWTATASTHWSART